MGDRLVLWSGGGRFVASKDVAAAAIVQISSSLSVNWGGGDVVSLTGSTWTTDQSFTSVTSSVFNIFRNGVAYGNSVHTPSFSWDKKIPLQDNGIKILRGDQMNYFHELKDTLYSYDAAWKGNSNVIAIIRELFKGGKYWGVVHFGAVPSSTTLTYSSHAFSINSPKTRVTSNTTQFSERNTLALPSISIVPSFFAVSVTYTDRTKTDIPVTYTPTWIQVKPANSCPPNTCFECVHDGEKCCFAKDTDGLIKVIDRFHITS